MASLPEEKERDVSMRLTDHFHLVSKVRLLGSSLQFPGM
jgi:hypothetical protein